MGFGFGLRDKFNKAKKEIAIRTANTFAKPNKNISAVYFHPSDMCEPDRIMLYALIRGLRPARVLEIGARWGGGARIISSALEDSGFGKAVGIDPEPKNFRPTPKELFHRYELMTGYSPGAIPEAVRKLGGGIDLAFIDAMHTHDHVLADFEGVIPFMAEGSHVLLHDTFHVGINRAIEEVLSANPTFVDCGFITRYPNIMDNAPVAYEGLRLVRTSTPANHITMKSVYDLTGKDASLSPEHINWDHYWNRANKSATSG
nr:class I SAM-dependent methyltransferase [uncultured Bradyrhizobium sp.]